MSDSHREHFYDKFESNENVEQFYNANAGVEDQRLDAGRLEFAVTLRVIRDLIQRRQDTNAANGSDSRESLMVADIGCGPGRYAIELAKDGHSVHISDLSRKCLELAEQKFVQAGIKPAEVLHCNVLDFVEQSMNPERSSFTGQSFDIVTLLGPMYHILDHEDRLQVLLSMIKMLKPGGFLVAAFVTRNAHLRDIAVRDPSRLLREQEFYNQYLQDGKYFRHTAGQMHHSTILEIRELLHSVCKISKDAEFVTMFGCEGFLGFHNAKHLNNLESVEFDKWVDIVMNAQDDTSLGASDHVLAVVRKF